MSTAIACLSIEGYEQYEVLPGCPAHQRREAAGLLPSAREYKIVKRGDESLAHFSLQDGQIRRKGEKPVLLREEEPA